MRFNRYVSFSHEIIALLVTNDNNDGLFIIIT